MLELYGNKLWNSNTPNKYKNVVVADENSLHTIMEALETAGLNYCAYTHKNVAYIAINKSDVDIVNQLHIDFKAIIQPNNKTYQTNNIIGNIKYRDIAEKHYRKYETDFAYKVAQRLGELGISFSGRVYGKSTTITVEKVNSEQLKKLSQEIEQERNSVKTEINDDKKNSAVEEITDKLNYSSEQLKAIAPSIEFLNDRIKDKNILTAFESLFSDTNQFSAYQLYMLSLNFVNTFRELDGISFLFANTSKFNEMKKDFINDNLTESFTKDKGFSSEQKKLIREMFGEDISKSVIELLDYTFSISEMQNFINAYKKGSYDELINIVAEVKGMTRIEIEGQIEEGKYVSAVPDFSTLLDRDLFFKNPDTERITYMYYNPDADSGGQFVITDISYGQLREASAKYPDNTSEFFDYLVSVGKQSAVDIGSEFFRYTLNEFYSNTHIEEGLNDDVKEHLTDIAVSADIKLNDFKNSIRNDNYESYLKIQSEHPDAIVFYRVGDFYEIIGSNAQKTSEILELTLMSRNINGEKIPMVGFPYFNLEKNEAVLIENGQKVIIVEPEEINSTRQNNNNEDIIQELHKLVENHQNNIKNADNEKQTIVINAFAGPGAGKTTSCLEIAEKLKKQGYVTEYVQEYAKELVYDNNFKLLDGSMQNQFSILKEQLKRVDRLYGKVDFIVTDSPLLLNVTYLKENSGEYKDSITELYNQFDNYNYFVERDNSAFETEGRIHNLEQSLQIDDVLKDTLAELNLEYKTYTHSTIDNIVSDVIEYKNNYSVSAQLNQLNKAQEIAKHNDLPFSDKFSEGADDEADPYVYDGSMSVQDFEKMQDNSDSNNELQQDVQMQVSDKLELKISFTESSLLNKFIYENFPDKKIPFALGNAIFEFLDEKQHIERDVDGLEVGYYDKTDFEITAIINGEDYGYEGRFDIGDGKENGNGSLIEHIESYLSYYVKNNPFEVSEERITEMRDYLDTAIPYFKEHSQLTEKEKKILDDFKAQNPIITSIKENAFSVYQIKSDEKYHFQRFSNYETLEKQGFDFSFYDYDMVYTGKLDDIDYPNKLEGIFTKFNTEIPNDFKGHSLSVSDVIVMDIDGNKTAYFVDSSGFKELPQFFRERRFVDIETEFTINNTTDSEKHPKQNNQGKEEILSSDTPAMQKEKLEAPQISIFDLPTENDDTSINSVDELASDINNIGENYTIADGNSVTGAKTKFRNNINAIRLLKTLESENRNATLQEQHQLSLYSGWGGLANAFEPDNEKWSKEYSELKELLSNDEYDSASASVLDAFYTDNAIIDSIYAVLKNAGFKGGDILEPAMGIGNFFGRLPQPLSNTTNLYGVEKDSLSGRIAQKLYPQANIRIDGFENTDFQDNSFDVAVGNIPFGDFSVNDRKYNSQNLKIHDYFFMKSLDKVREGGIVAFVTSKGTLDKKDSSFRKLLSERADLVGAVRLPNNAFKSAGTEVTPDIIFLQKRSEPPVQEPSWVHIGQNESGLKINNYFIEHPEMVLGDIVEGNKLYGRNDDTMCIPFSDGRTLSELLPTAVENIKFKYSASLDKPSPISEKLKSVIIPDNIRSESYFKSVNEIYFYGSDSEGNLTTSPASQLLNKKYSSKIKERITDFIGLRDTLRELIAIQQLEDTDDKITELQNKLGSLYDDFYKKHGLLHSNYNRSILGFDGAYQLVASLEQEYDKNQLIKKSDIFTQRVNVPKPTIERVDTATEALAVSIADKGIIDFAYMSKLSDIDEVTLANSLRESGEIFPVPELSTDDNIVYQTASEYLSGDIYAKLDTAQYYANENNLYLANCTALEAVIPPPLKAGDIDINLGATWIDKKYYQEFMYELFKTPKEQHEDYKPKWIWQQNNSKKIVIEYSEYSGKWNISNKSADKSVTVMKTFGAHNHSAYEIFEAALNLTEPKVYKYKLDEFGHIVYDKKNNPVRELDVPATQVVQQKANAIRREFKNWIFKDSERRKDIIDTYNRTFNCIKPREYDGSHLTFPGMNSNIELHEHQKNAIAHAIYGGNTLFAHTVGAGKTFEMIATAMECKRLGLCHKSLFAVPNHLTEQVGADFLKLYPQANILVATKDDFKSENRKRLMSKIATGNYDAVIIGHSQLKMLPLSPERQKEIYQEQIQNIIIGIRELKAQDGSNFKVKDMERTKRSLEKQLEKLQSSKKDNSIYFEELGIDKLFIDEAHEFKNLFCTTKLQNVSGISSRASQRATELFAKCRYLDEKTGGKGVVFATGTPISNSVTELHTMMRYLNYDFLSKHNNMQNFDNWVSTFGVQKKEYELAPAGNKFKERTRIAEYSNLPELLSMFKIVADIRTSDTLKLKVPECEMHVIDVEPTELQRNLVDELSDRADEINSGMVDPSVDNMLKITGDGRKLGLDPRLIDPDFEDNPNTKLNVCVNNTFDIYQKTSDKKLTQIIFCDLGVPGKGSVSSVDNNEQDDSKSVAEIDSLEETGRFCVYDDIKAKLISKGVPADEIAYIHDAKTEKQKTELFAKVRSGEVRILLGSTSKMGTGTNVQDRIIAMHDLDVPWRPSDLEQRRGRMVRQGNINEKVHLFRYVTKGTFDAYSYQLLEKKQKFISQIMTSKSPARKCSDVDQAALTYSEIKALCTGDERIREKLTLENRVKELNAYKSDYNNTRYELEDKVNAYPEQRKKLLCIIGNIQKDIDTFNAIPKDSNGKPIITFNFGGKKYKVDSDENRKATAKALGIAIAPAKIVDNKHTDIRIGDICGFPVEVCNKGYFSDRMDVKICGNHIYESEFGVSSINNVLKLEKLLCKFNDYLTDAKSKLNKLDIDFKSAQEMLGKPFEYEAELSEKTQRLSELTKILNIEIAEKPIDRSKNKTHYFSKDSILNKNKNLQSKDVSAVAHEKKIDSTR